MKRLYTLSLTPLLCLLFLLPVHATENHIVERKHRNQYFLASIIEDDQFDFFAPIVHRTGIHPHIVDDCGLLVKGYLKKKGLKRIAVPSCIQGLLAKYLAGDLDRRRFDKISGVNNDTGCFLAWCSLQEYFGLAFVREPSQTVKILVNVKGTIVYRMRVFSNEPRNESCCKIM